MNKQAFVYILANQRNGTLYTGVTSNLVKRMHEHKTKAQEQSFTAKYTLDKLVWYMEGDDIAAAIELEKKIKNRNRAWKIALIEHSNPEWNDLSLDFLNYATEAQNDQLTPPCHAARSCSIHMDSAIAQCSTQNDERGKP